MKYCNNSIGTKVCVRLSLTNKKDWEIKGEIAKGYVSIGIRLLVEKPEGRLFSYIYSTSMGNPFGYERPKIRRSMDASKRCNLQRDESNYICTTDWLVQC